MATSLLVTLSSLFLAAAPAPLFPPEVGVPFACGQTFTVSQAHEVGSHLQNDTWAWDFRMPEGVPIVAALDGTVRLARGDSAVGGCDPKYARFANYVVLAHGNGLETQYLHFSQVTVREGDAVKRGDLLGYSGSTGWACGSHLHFKVAQPLTPGWNNPSVPARLVGYGDPERGVVIASSPCSQPTMLAQQPSQPQASPEQKASLVSATTPSPASATGSSSAVQPATPSAPRRAPAGPPQASPPAAPTVTADATPS